MKVQEEKEAAREERERLREERKAEQELAAERERLAKERAHYVNALEALRARRGPRGARRPDGAAERNRRGHRAQRLPGSEYPRRIRLRHQQYGAFGPNVVKIGLTRRLEPMDRVRELGDASVPFPFDVHAIFFSDDAVTWKPSCTAFAAPVNVVNQRREFFFATPAEVREVLTSRSATSSSSPTSPRRPSTSRAGSTGPSP